MLHQKNKKMKNVVFKVLQNFPLFDNIRVYQKKGVKNMTVNEICEMLNIKGLITCSESDKFISVSHNGMTWLYNKATGTLRAL